MIAVPASSEVHACLADLATEIASEEAAFHFCTIEVESSRIQTLGVADIMELVDLSWAVIAAFFASASLPHHDFQASCLGSH